MENEFIYYDTTEEVIESVKSMMRCDDCKFCYTWKNDGRWYRCENESAKENGIDQISNPRTFGCIYFEKIEENE